MQDAKHTPGPWCLGEIRDDQIDIDAKSHGALARVAWLMDDDKLLGRNSPEEEANARLIAAAPDYDKAARDVLAVLERFGDWDDGCFYYSGKSAPELQQPMRDLAAAIAKATAAESEGV